MATRVTTFTGFLTWVALTALMGLVPGWTQAFLGWALTSLAEDLIPGYAELQAQ